MRSREYSAPNRKDTIMVEVEKKRLTDGSYVFDVLIDSARWQAVDEDSAFALQDAIVEAARKYANNDTIRGLFGDD